jgi:hypothetical protein
MLGLFTWPKLRMYPVLVIPSCWYMLALITAESPSRLAQSRRESGPVPVSEEEKSFSAYRCGSILSTVIPELCRSPGKVFKESPWSSATQANPSADGQKRSTASKIAHDPAPCRPFGREAGRAAVVEG